MSVIFAVIWGAVSAFALVVVVGHALRAGRKLADVRGTPTSPIARAPSSGRVEIAGKVVAGPEGAARSPVLGVDAVTWWTQISEDLGSARKILATLERDADFFVDDGSGALARVSPKNAKVMLAPQRTAGPEAEARAHALAVAAKPDIDPKRVFFSETVLAPGDAVYALGEASLDSGGPVPAAYRDRPSRILVVTAPAGGELLLGDDERAVAAQLAVRRTILWCAAAGLVVVGAFPAIAAALGH